LRTAEEIQRAIDASEAVFGLDLEPWDAFTAYMYSAYGRRDPECIHCGQRVWMALQGFYSGGMLTTDPSHEGPVSGGDLQDAEFRCEWSPDGEHSTDVTATWGRAW